MDKMGAGGGEEREKEATRRRSELRALPHIPMAFSATPRTALSSLRAFLRFFLFRLATMVLTCVASAPVVTPPSSWLMGGPEDLDRDLDAIHALVGATQARGRQWGGGPTIAKHSCPTTHSNEILSPTDPLRGFHCKR